MTKRKQAFSGGAGEHLVLGEILKRGVEAYLAHGKTQPGWDIAVVNPGNVPIRVQVKAINWPHDTAVNGKFDAGFDVLVVVLLNGENQSRYLVIPHSALEPHLSPSNPGRGGERTLTVGKNYETHVSKDLKQYEGKWENITSVVQVGLTDPSSE
ncbi:hypothetical protein [Cystobacter fuscus]|uniref:hypothetical protein n=1 Tax=Cystobacter fuscus TaxID=43 RepID=UPI002B3134A6|nr:hypothetical protein F0U63_35150 [Cystobacter fuscus]